jgi:type II secretory ATPase GspE/PulE/Tfp pilus assembly ATPase PilB-like protein
MRLQSQRIETVAERPPATAPALDDRWLAPVLVGEAVLTPDQAGEIGVALDEGVWRSAVERQWATDEQIVSALAHAFRIDQADLATADPNATQLLPEKIARRHQVVALRADDRTIRVATADPRNLNAEQDLRFITGRDVVFSIASPAALVEKLDQLYRPERSIERLLTGLEPARVEVVETEAAAPRDPVLDAPVARLVEAMISDAVREGASDIHAEATEGAFVVRYRVDGVLREVMRLPEAAGTSLVRRVKVLAKLDVTDPLRPHDGRATARVDGQLIDLRVSTIPIARRGEKAVIRILDRTKLRGQLGDLELPAHETALLERLLGHREGMVLVTGPTGSGKTTTLYAALNHLKTGKVNIVTVEDPVEYDVAGISQIQVSEAQGLTFAGALRSVLRQDPDIVLVGEIRDLETAVTAVQAGFTGHLVLSTLHTNDAPSAVTRLRDMGVDSFKLAAVLKGILAQRLVRRVCVHCAETITPEELPGDARPPADWAGTVAIRRAVGCKRCNGSGYKGRTAVVEIVPVDESVAKVIEGDQPPDAIAAAARRIGMRTLWESGLERVWGGATTLEELHRVLGERVHEDGSTSPLEHGARAAAAAAASAAKSPARTVAPPAPPAAPSGETRILIADDDAQMRRLVRSVLQREGFAVEEAADGLDALEKIEGGQVDLLISDYDMPRLDGLGLLEELRAQMRTATLPVIMLTSHTDGTEEQALELGAQDFLAKPVQVRSLVARVKAVLRRAKE